MGEWPGEPKEDDEKRDIKSVKGGFEENDNGPREDPTKVGLDDEREEEEDGDDKKNLRDKGVRLFWVLPVPLPSFVTP